MTDIVFYHYSFSPFARRVQWYMLLRGLPYTECIQPPLMPRPDVARLGLGHRRVPVLAIGRDVYVDSRLILAKLEQLPTPAGGRGPLGVGREGAPELRGLERLFDGLTIDGLFLTASTLIPSNASLMLDPAFRADRHDFFGRSVDPAAHGPTHALHRAEALAELRAGAQLLETTVLADGRAWLLATPAPALADIETVWLFHWLAMLPGALSVSESTDPADAVITAAQFPRLFAWIDRFQAAVRAARKARPATATTRVQGEAAAAAVLQAPFYETTTTTTTDAIDAADPVVRATGLRAGQQVVVWPTDTGASGRDVGRLVRLTADEVVLALEAPCGTAPRLHAPRHGFVVRPSEAKL